MKSLHLLAAISLASMVPCWAAAQDWPAQGWSLTSNHNDTFTKSALSQDGQLLATISTNSRLQIWNTVKRTLIIDDGLLTNQPYSVAFSPDSRLLVVGESSGVAELFSASTGSRIWTRNLYNSSPSISAVQFSPDSSCIYFSTGNSYKNDYQGYVGKVTVFGKRLYFKSVTPYFNINTLCLSPDGTSLAIGGSDRFLRRLSASDGTSLAFPTIQQDGEIISVLWGAKGVIYSASNNKTVMKWNDQTGKPLGSAITLSSTPTALCLQNDSNAFAVALADGTVQTFTSGGAHIQNGPAYSGFHNNSLEPTVFSSIKYSADNRWIFCSGRSNEISVRSVGSLNTSYGFGNPENNLSSIGWFPDGTGLFASYQYSAMSTWSAVDGHQITREFLNGTIQSTTISSDGKTLAVGYSSGKVDLIRGATKTNLSDSGQGGNRGIRGMAFSSDGATLYSVSDDNNIRIWKPSSPGLPTKIPTSTNQLSVAINPIGGSNYATGNSDGTVTIWNSSNNMPTLSIGALKDQIWSLKYASDGKSLFVRHGSTISAFELEKGAEIVRISDPLNRGFTAMDLSTDGRTICTSSNSGKLAFWNALTGAFKLDLDTGVVDHIAYCPVQGQIALTYGDKTSIIGDPLYTTPLGLLFADNCIVGGQFTFGQVYLSAPAGSSGLTVNLKADSSSILVPSSVTVNAGNSYADFLMITVPTPTAKTAAISASAKGTTIAASVVILEPSVADITLSSSLIQGGKPVTGTVTLSGLAPNGDVSLNLSSSSKNAVVPPTVTIKAGQTSATFSIATTAVTQSTLATIRVVGALTLRQATLTLTK